MQLKAFITENKATKYGLLHCGRLGCLEINDDFEAAP